MKSIFRCLYHPCLAITVAVLMLLASGPRVQAASKEDAERYIQNVGDRALAILNDSALPKAKKQAALQVLFLDNVDLDWVSRFVLGSAWRQASPEQRSLYQEQYKRFLLAHYVSHFADYGSGAFAIQDTQDLGDEEYLVTMQLRPNIINQQPVMVGYRVRKPAGSGVYHIFDVIIEGVSLLASQRQEFSAIVAEHGIDYLVDQLKQKAREPLGAKP